MRQFYAILPPGRPWILATLCLALIFISLPIALLMRKEPLIRGSGIPDVERRLRSYSPISFPWWRILWRKTIGGLLFVGPGTFAGREGPSIQMGACVGMGVSHLTATSRAYRHELVAAGAAAGLSAAFNAPIAAVLFVTEEIYGRFTAKSGMAALSAALSAGTVSTLVFGTEPVFALPRVSPPPLYAYWRLGLLALALGAFAWLYQTTLLNAGKAYDALRIPTLLRPAIPLLLTIPVGMACPSLLGGGNTLVTSLGQQRYTLPLLLTFLAIRFLLSQITYGSGAPGGIFLPILTLGALTGATWASFPTLTGTPNNSANTTLMIIAGMAGLFGAVSKAPLTALILVTEMTSYDLLMPLGFVTLIAYTTYDILGGKPIYDALSQPTPTAKKATRL